MEQEIKKAFQSARLFVGIREEDMPHVLDCIGAHERQYGKAEFIFLEGDDMRQVALVARGMVHMVKEDVWGDKMLLMTYGTGEVFGESFVCNDRAEATVSFQAAADCHILLLPFHRLLCTCGMSCRFHHQLIENMVFLIAQKNVQLMEKMEVLSKKTIREKILVWLSQQVQRNENRRFASTMGRLALAEYLCVDRSALTRELSNMQADGLLRYDKNIFELLG